MHGNATCIPDNWLDKIPVKSCLPDSETGDVRLTVTLAGRLLARSSLILSSCVLSHARTSLATAQVPDADPPGGTQGLLFPRRGLIVSYWRVAQRLR